MEWLWNAMWARVGWALGELLWVIILIVAFIVAFFLYAIFVSIRERLCAHAETRQLPSSPARKCRACGKVFWPEVAGSK